MTDEQTEVWELVRESNRAWMAGATHELTGLFDERAVMVLPGLQGRVEGREAEASRPSTVGDWEWWVD